VGGGLVCRTTAAIVRRVLHQAAQDGGVALVMSIKWGRGFCRQAAATLSVSAEAFDRGVGVRKAGGDGGDQLALFGNSSRCLSRLLRGPPAFGQARTTFTEAVPSCGLRTRRARDTLLAILKRLPSLRHAPACVLDTAFLAGAIEDRFFVSSFSFAVGMR